VPTPRSVLLLDVHIPTWYRVRSLSTSIDQSPKSNSHTFSLLCKIWINTHSKHLTQPHQQHFRSKFPIPQRKNKQKPISQSALKMTPTPFTSLPFVFVTLLSILHLSHCKTLKRDGNVSYLTQPLHPCRFLSTFLQFG